MYTIPWKSFDADKPNPEMEKFIKQLSERILAGSGVDKTDHDAVKSYAREEILKYSSGTDRRANQTLVVNIFRPHEFDAITSNDESLKVFMDWLFEQQLDWRNGSRHLQIAIDDSFSSGGSKSVSGGREKVILDNLVVIEGRKVAIEIETSKNIDNGYWTLRQALRTNMADYGVMIVPWTAEGSGRADEGKAVGRLDREFDGTTTFQNRAIYRIAIIRLLDIYRLMLESKAAPQK